MTTEAKAYSPTIEQMNGYKPKDHSNGNNRRDGHALLETEPIVSHRLREQLAGVEMVFVSPRGAARNPDGTWTNSRYSSDQYTPLGNGPQAGALRPIAIQQLRKTGLLPKDIPIVVPSGHHPKESFTWHDLTKKELERRGVPSQQITTDNRSLDTVGEQGVLLEISAREGYRKVVQITDITQMPRQEMILLLYKCASGNPSEGETQSFMEKLMRHPVMDIFSSEQMFKDIYEYTLKRQTEEGMLPENQQAELQRLSLVREAANDRQAFFQDFSPEEMRLIANAYFDNHAAKTGKDWRAIVTPDVLKTIGQNGTRIVQVPAEEVFKETSKYLGWYARGIESSPAALRTFGSEFAGIAQARLYVYNAPPPLSNEVTNGFFNRRGTSEFLRQNRQRYKQTLTKTA